MNQIITVSENLPAYYAHPDGDKKSPAIILIHEIWGLKDHIKDVANRLSTEGYAVLAPDFFADVKFEGQVDQSILDEMMNPETRDEAQKKMRTLFAPVHSPEFAKGMITKLENCFAFLQNDAHSDGQVAIMGFCFGGSYSFAFAAHEPKIRGAIPFYGQPPEPLAEQVPHITCPVLAFYGEKDERLMESLPKLEAAMLAEGKAFERVVYPNTGHAFFNDTNARMYNKEAAQDAWQKALAFLKKNLA